MTISEFTHFATLKFKQQEAKPLKGTTCTLDSIGKTQNALDTVKN